MKKRIRRILSFLLCLVLILNTAGCWNRRELNTLAIVLGLGIDKAQEPGQIELTAQIAKPSTLKSSSKGEIGGSGKAFWNIKGSGDTLFTTIRDFTHESNRKLYFPHIQVLIFSQDLAEEGVQQQMDLFVRDHETRLNIWILVSKNKASEVLDVVPELDKISAMNITKLLEAQAATSQTSVVKLNQFITRLISKTTAPIAPFIEVTGEGDKKTVQVKGTAVFKKDKLIGELDKMETRGLLWVIDEVKSGMIDVSCSNDDKVSLEILRAKAKVTPELIDDEVHMKIDITEEGTIATQYCTEDIASTPEKIEALESKQSAAIQEEVMAAIKKAKDLNADVFGFGDVVHQNYRDEWKRLEGDWDEIFPTLEVEITVESKLRRSGRSSRPPAPEKE